MGQWGKTYEYRVKYSGQPDLVVRMVPHIDTGDNPFVVADRGCIVDGIICLHAEGVEILINKVLSGARTKFVGQQYDAWLKLVEGA